MIESLAGFGVLVIGAYVADKLLVAALDWL